MMTAPTALLDLALIDRARRLYADPNVPGVMRDQIRDMVSEYRVAASIAQEPANGHFVETVEVRRNELEDAVRKWEGRT